jgi:hypothetical protein
VRQTITVTGEVPHKLHCLTISAHPACQFGWQIFCSANITGAFSFLLSAAAFFALAFFGDLFYPLF